MSERRLAAVVLAAGASTRLGQPKQLLSLHGEMLVERAVRMAREAGADPVFVVLGARFDEILQRMQAGNVPARVLINRAWERGLSSSIALGAAAAERAGADDLLLLACDQPAVTSWHLRALVARSGCEHVVASTYANRRGTPAMFPDFAFHALQELTGDTGARDFLRSHEVLTVALPGGDFDVDTPEDLLRLQAMDKGIGPSLLSA